MRAIITAELGFRCAPEGHTVVTYDKGQQVEGRAAEIAVTAGAARRLDDVQIETKPAPALEAAEPAPVERKTTRKRRAKK